MRRVDWTEFRNTGLAGVTLPTDQDRHVTMRHYPCVVRRLVAALEGRYDGETAVLRARVSAAAARLCESPETGIWHVDELGRTAEARLLARRIITAAQDACTGEPGARL